ncbi:MAG: PEP-CTERM sorting domain-containing protein [Fimbriimonadaceae bacterium]|nr:PEP-CTERM sorting domain-containing protein [Fimbriimonadaceae bacterium]
MRTVIKLSALAALAAGAATASAVDPQVFFRIGGNGQNNGQNDVWLDYIKYSQNQIYTDFLGPRQILNFTTSGGSTNTGIRVVAGTNTSTNPNKFAVLDDGDGKIEGAEMNKTNFVNRLTQAFNSRNINEYLDMSGNDANFSMVLDFTHNPLRNKIVYFERGGGGSNSWLQLEAVDAQGKTLGQKFVVQPRTSTDMNLNTVTYSWGKTQSGAWSQQLSFYDLDVADLGVSSISYLKVSMPQGVKLGPGEDFQPDFRIYATRDAVPEPATMLLLGGAGAAAIWRKRRRKA